MISSIFLSADTDPTILVGAHYERINSNYKTGKSDYSIYEACEYFDKKLAEIPHTPQFEVIMDGHSHLDIAWLWRCQETERKTSRTFANNLALMDH